MYTHTSVNQLFYSVRIEPFVNSVNLIRSIDNNISPRNIWPGEFAVFFARKKGVIKKVTRCLIHDSSRRKSDKSWTRDASNVKLGIAPRFVCSPKRLGENSSLNDVLFSEEFRKRRTQCRR